MGAESYKWYDVSSGDALERTARVNSRWFYAIAGLSLVNTFLQYIAAPIRVVLGLAFTQLVDDIVAGVFPHLYYTSAAMDVVIAAAFFGLGYLGGKGEILAFVVGLALYVLDGLVYLALTLGHHTFTGIIALIWHGIVAYSLWKGLEAVRELKALRSEGVN